MNDSIFKVIFREWLRNAINNGKIPIQYAEAPVGWVKAGTTLVLLDPRRSKGDGE